MRPRGATGALRYRSFPSIAGTDTIRVTATDGTATTTAELVIAIAGSGSSPLRFGNAAPYQVDEQGFLLFEPVVVDAAADADLVFRLVGLTPGVGDAADLVFDTATGTINWTLVPRDADGYHRFGMVVTDRANQQAAYLPITVHVVTPPLGDS